MLPLKLILHPYSVGEINKDKVHVNVLNYTMSYIQCFVLADSFLLRGGSRFR